MAELPNTTRGRATRERILRAATDAIEERGASRLSLDDVMARAGVSKGQVYHYFENREALLHAAAGDIIDGVVDAQQEMMEQLDSWQRIRDWFDCLVSLQVDRDAHGGCPMASLAAHLAETDEHARMELVDGYDRWEGLLRAGLVAMRDAGELDEAADAEQLATATMAAIQGGLVLTQVRRDPGQLRTALDGAWSYLRSFAAGAG